MSVQSSVVPLSSAVPTTARRVTGFVRIAAALTLAFALGFQIVEKTVHNDLVPSEYFSFFTIQVSIIAIVVLFAGGMVALRHPTDSAAYTTIRMSVLAYAIMTAVVYNLLLRGLPDTGFVASAWPGEIMHVWIPIVMALDWLLAPGRARLRFGALVIVLIYPVAWLLYTFVRGAIVGWYPYPFLEPSTGLPSVAAYIGAIFVFVLIVAVVAIALSRLGSPKSRD
ncbi:MAG: hypothetical protein EPN91_09760 [Salinibacterium sp.]|nr:MAG: hypothetical protein EPN91_09760 [Salinibacterium sp.]